MFNSSMIDIVIGLVFIFLLLSIFATAINEILLSFLSMRGKFLVKGIAMLLDDLGEKPGLLFKKRVVNEDGPASAIYQHGQVFGLYQGPFNPKKFGNLPSYIPSRNFALAFLDFVKSKAPSAQAPAQVSAQPPPPAQQRVAASVSAVPAVLPAVAPAQTIQAPAGAVNAPATAVSQAIPISQQLIDGANALARVNEKVGRPFISMIEMAGNDAAKLQKSVEDWFNSGMDRVSGAYKYHTQFCLFWIGVILAVAMNANTIRIVRQLSNDAPLRQSLVEAARTAKPPAPAPATTQSPDQTQAPLSQDQIQKASTAFQNVRTLGLPLGWTPEEIHSFATGGLWPGLNAIIGWFVTAIAISLGAPFWFDALNKIMVIRSTIKPTEKSQDEGSKDKPKT